MDARKAGQWIVADASRDSAEAAMSLARRRKLWRRSVTILIIAAGMCGSVAIADTTRVYSQNFDIPLNNPTGVGSAMTEATIDVPDHFVISDLDVEINITHTRVFDLQLILQSPTGAWLCLNKYDFDDFFEGENYTNTIFDDEARLSIEDANAPFTGHFRPEAGYLLEVFDGSDAYGPWLLQIYDMWPTDTGTLDNVELTFTVPEPASVLLMTFGTTILTLHRKKR